jgi:glycosyltransferase involved in cell wall biosynthesis
MNPDRRSRPHICIVVAAPLTLKAFMLGHLEALARIAEVTVAANFSPEDESFPWPAEIRRVAIPIARPIAPWADLVALLALFRLFRRRRFDLVHSITPKAGLLAMLAGALARVPLRLHTFQGEVWVTRRGALRWLLKNLDRLLARLATDLLVVSESEREFLIAAGLIPAAKSRVLKHGSIAGVDCERFKPDSSARAALRADLGIPVDAPVFLFVGRLNRDKGVLDLARAFAVLAREDAACQLLIVGTDEEGLRPEIEQACAACRSRLHLAGFSAAPERYIATSDVLCLPSYREGFGVVIIEAAAAGVPAIGSRIYGITDAIVEGETGLLFEAGDVQQLALSMRTLAGDASLRRRMGQRARERAVRDFSSAVVTAALVEYYEKLLAHHAD